MSATEYYQRFRGKKFRAGKASQLEKVSLNVFPTVIDKIDGFNIIYEETSDKRTNEANEFAGLTWDFKPEVTLYEMDLRTCLGVLVTVLEVHLPERRLGRPLLGSEISLVSFVHL